jgi:hypothetical protein
MSDAFERLVDEYPAWWIDFLGEHNHIGGEASTRWLAERAILAPGALVLDAGGFVGAVGRLLAREFDVRAVVTDIAPPFLAAGARLDGGGRVHWVTALTQKLPFATGLFASVWCLDSYVAPRELSRVAAADATLCLCCDVPDDSRGGMEAFLDEWAEHGWRLTAHKTLSLEATNTWRKAEGELVRRRPHYEERYGKRGYLAQLDQLSGMVRSYELREQGHGLFAFTRGASGH